MIVVGIDPGLSGAVAALRGADLLRVFDLPTEDTGSSGNTKRRLACAQLAAQLRDLRGTYGGEPLCAVVERVAASSQQGVSSAFSFGDSAGALRGVLQTLAIRIEFVSPVTWKRAMKLTNDKGLSLTLARQRWPEHASTFARVRDDGRAEAALIAAWGWDQFA